MLKALAKKKWFVPAILILLGIIALSAFTEREPSDTTKSLEEQLEELCNNVRGVSDAKVMITYAAVPASVFDRQKGSEQSILGIAVICNGGGNPHVQLTILEIIKTLFQISSTQITISERK
jgi:hypothetical protein